MTKGFLGQMDSQDISEASLWFGMVGQHLTETNFDTVIREVAAKTLNRVQMTGIPLDHEAVESDLSKELSTRVGWDVSGQIQGMFASNLNDDIQNLNTLSSKGLSSSLIELSKEMAVTGPQIAPASYVGNTFHTHLFRVGQSGGNRNSGRSGNVSQLCAGIANTVGVAGSASATLALFCQIPMAEAFISGLFEFPGACASLAAAFGGVAGVLSMVQRSSICQ